MAENISIFLEDHFERFSANQIKSGRFSSAGKVIAAALKLLEKKEKEGKLIQELEIGERSGFVQKFDRQKFLDNLHDQYLSNDL